MMADAGEDFVMHCGSVAGVCVWGLPTVIALLSSSGLPVVDSARWPEYGGLQSAIRQFSLVPLFACRRFGTVAWFWGPAVGYYQVRHSGRSSNLPVGWP